MKKDTRIINLSVMPVWKLVTIILCIVTICIGSVFLIGSFLPSDIQALPSRNSNLKLSPQIKNYIDDVVKRDTNIIGIQVVTVNFVRNIRIDTYVSIDNVFIQTLYDNFIAKKIVETPVFTEDKINNNRVLRLINGDFVCIPYAQSTAYKYAPEGGSVVSTVCAIAIPPQHFGEFSGILSIYLNNIPTKESMNSLFIFSRDLSTDIGEYNDKIENSK